MRIATWNINSLRARMDRVLAFLDRHQVDVLALQETKAKPSQLDLTQLVEAGYEVHAHGLNQWNGVALVSRVGLEDVRPELPTVPVWPEDETGVAEARAISGVVGDGLRIWSLYVPNGREVASDHYGYKLDWLEALRAAVADGPADVALCGDINIAPTDDDVFDPAAYIGHTHVTAPERAAVEAFGLVDVLRERWPGERVFSYWDYRAGMFHQDLGMRIDLILASAPVAARAKAAWVDREARKGKLPSDHAPVIVDLDEAPDGDIGPVVPPPSRPAKLRRGVTLPQGSRAGSQPDPTP